MQTTTLYLISGASRAIGASQLEISMALAPTVSPANRVTRIAAALAEIDKATNAIRDALLIDGV